jgi:hypothetical protein
MKFILLLVACIAILGFMNINAHEISSQSTNAEIEKITGTSSPYKRLFLTGAGTALLAAVSLYIMHTMNGYHVHNLESSAIALIAYVAFTISGSATVYYMGNAGYDFLGFNHSRKS